eukprot:TRINITY_DN3364_c0_g1_i1.p1 TRINITY_DN3364_c0_g1~~TRINITY_DN3364_c0_g1_i1.p1  ORF type:complete len:314 (+),score=44.21 TRINITY_DN3364_c0_g1_i1:124-942(+)
MGRARWKLDALCLSSSWVEKQAGRIRRPWFAWLEGQPSFDDAFRGHSPRFTSFAHVYASSSIPRDERYELRESDEFCGTNGAPSFCEGSSRDDFSLLSTWRALTGAQFLRETGVVSGRWRFANGAHGSEQAICCPPSQQSPPFQGGRGGSWRAGGALTNARWQKQGYFGAQRAALPSAPSLHFSSCATSSEDAFHELADEVLHHLQEKIDELTDAVDLEGAEVDYSQGVLTIRLGPELGTFVINKQTPNRQIWFSSPVSGPARFDWIAEEEA